MVFHDITSGSNGYPATAGYNMVAASARPSPMSLTPVSRPAPTITSVSANPSPVTSGTTSTLTVVASDFAGLTLTYTWSTVFSPGGVQAPNYSAAGTVTATGDNTLVTFYGTGQYEFAVRGYRLVRFVGQQRAVDRGGRGVGSRDHGDPAERGGRPRGAAAV